MYPGINMYHVSGSFMEISDENFLADILGRKKPDMVCFHLFKYSNNGDAKVISAISKDYKIAFTAHDHILVCPGIKKIRRSCNDRRIFT